MGGWFDKRLSRTRTDSLSLEGWKGCLGGRAALKEGINTTFTGGATEVKLGTDFDTSAGAETKSLKRRHSTQIGGEEGQMQDDVLKAEQTVM